MTRPPRGEVSASETIKARVEPAVKARFVAAAAAEGITLSEWLIAAGELALARGSTR